MYTTSATLLHRIEDMGDDAGWREFYERYVPLVYKVARDQGLKDADAEDVAQLVMLGVARGIRGYDRSRGSFRRWLLGAVYNKIRDVRARNGRQIAPAELADLATEPSEDQPFVILFERQWRQTLLHESVEKVRREGDDVAFQAFWLRTVDGRSVQQVAEALGLKVERVYEYKHRIGRRIAEDYQARLEAADEC